MVAVGWRWAAHNVMAVWRSKGVPQARTKTHPHESTSGADHGTHERHEQRTYMCCAHVHTRVRTHVLNSTHWLVRNPSSSTPPRTPPPLRQARRRSLTHSLTSPTDSPEWPNSTGLSPGFGQCCHTFWSSQSRPVMIFQLPNLADATPTSPRDLLKYCGAKYERTRVHQRVMCV